MNEIIFKDLPKVLQSKIKSYRADARDIFYAHLADHAIIKVDYRIEELFDRNYNMQEWHLVI